MPRHDDARVDGSHSLVREGIGTGLIGAVVVAAWFLVRDALAGRPLLTPNVLGQIFILGDASPRPEPSNPGAIAGFAVLHLVGFVLIGLFVAWLIHASARSPLARIGLVIFFFADLVFLLGIAQMLSSQTRAMFPAWSVLVAVLLGFLAMGLFLWRRHPGFRAEVSRVPLGDTPDDTEAS